MRDLHLRHTLKSLARDASAVFAEIVAAGQEIPYEIADPGEGAAFCQYRPLTARFVRDNAAELRELESFHEATETMRRTDVAAPYLVDAGIQPPADGVERATLAVTYFLARLWDGCADFEIDEDRFDAALEEVEQCEEPEAGEVEAIVPLIGLQMPLTRVELEGASIVRADTVDAPPEVARNEREGAEWQPTFLISTRAVIEDGGMAAAGQGVARTFERVVTTLRLFQRGGVGLGPHGWVRVAGDRWRRISTGAGRPRAGGYVLSEEDLPELIDLSRTVALHPKRVDRLRRALLRFESGLDRRGAIDALNDHLLGLRFLLEGEGPAGVGLAARAAALAAGTEERDELRLTVESALALEREMWSGEPIRAASSAGSPSEVATRIEDMLRTIVRRGVTGELGSDLRAAADEALLSDGLAAGAGVAGELAATAWDLDEAEEPVEEPAYDDGAFERFEADTASEVTVARPAELAAAASAEEDADEEPGAEEAAEGEDDYEMPTVPEELSNELGELEQGLAQRPVLGGRYEVAEEEPEEAFAEDQLGSDEDLEPPAWLEEVGGNPADAMQFPQRPVARDNHLEELSRPPMERSEVRARVEYLFPRTETDWTVGKRASDRDAAAS